jgi:hypothetical protein
MRIVGSAILASLACASTWAQQGKPARGFYAAVDFGQSQLDRSSESPASFDNRSSAYAARVGYRFNRYVRVESGYTDLGNFRVELFQSATLGETAIDGFLFNTIFVWPISQHFQLSVSLGGFYSTVDGKIQRPDQADYKFSQTGLEFETGLGLAIPINDHFEIGLDYHGYYVPVPSFAFSEEFALTGDTNAEAYTLGLIYKF